MSKRTIALVITVLATVLLPVGRGSHSMADEPSPGVCWWCIDWGYGYRECSIVEMGLSDCMHWDGKCWLSGPVCIVHVN